MDAKLKAYMEWFVAFRDPLEIWQKHQSFLICEIIFYFFTLLTLKHAFSHGGRYKYLWLATFLHGVVVETVSYNVPDIDNFWHAQSCVMLLGKRLPLHVAFIYPCFYYTAVAIAARLHLKKWCEPFAVGLIAVLIDIPFDIMGIKLLWWSWHDTDPNVFDRAYWVPWTSYYFHASFAASLCFVFHGSRALISSKEKFVSAGFFSEMLCTLLTGALSMPLGVIQFIGVYHGLHDNFAIHTEVCVLIFLGFYAFMFWCGDRYPCKEARFAHKSLFDELGLIVFAHYLFYALLVVYQKPENIRATGLHEPIGNCSHTVPVFTPLGQTLSKRTYLCPTDYTEAYFDFHCLPGGKAPKEGSSWYTICGTPFENHVEYMVVVFAFCLLGFAVMFQFLSNSGKQPKGYATVVVAPPVSKSKQKRH